MGIKVSTKAQHFKAGDGMTFMRQKTIFSRKEDWYREVDIFRYTDNQRIASKKGKRAGKTKESEPKQKNLNDKNARRYFIQLCNFNFTSKDLHISLTYNEENLPATMEEAERKAVNYIRRIQYQRDKVGLPKIKYLLITSMQDGVDGTPARLHHHIIMNGGLPREMVEDMWTETRINWRRYQTEPAYRETLKSIGYVNADRLQVNHNGLGALGSYLARQGGGKKRWTSSQNLYRPYSLPNDGRFTARQIEQYAKKKMGREFWEKKYPGWTLLDERNGVRYEYSDVTGWAVYLKLRRKEPEQEKT